MGSHELPGLRRQKTHRCVPDRVLNLTLFSFRGFDYVAILLGSTVLRFRVFDVSLFELIRQNSDVVHGEYAKLLTNAASAANQTFLQTSTMAQNIIEGSADDGTRFSIWLLRLEDVIRMRPVPPTVAREKVEELFADLRKDFAAVSSHLRSFFESPQQSETEMDCPMDLVTTDQGYAIKRARQVPRSADAGLVISNQPAAQLLAVGGTITIRVNRLRMLALIDTGAGITVASQFHVSFLGITKLEPDMVSSPVRTAVIPEEEGKATGSQREKQNKQQRMHA
ncbi:unnamed protein product [Nippostrongylus brasiliensis]|uniref:Peptidase A2 domain-containing protein n=1 Tax=Nippostrongylus brasiliensis TaxID=27835 RepID=A0A0N4XX28_NIPBR|nr:unnamed protein product [Nippostrongylus brasiliensis]